MTRLVLLTALSALAAATVTIVTFGSVWLYVWWIIAPGLAVAAVAVGLRRHRPVVAHPWWVLLAALVLLWIGWSIAAILGAGLGSPAALESLALARDLIYLVAYPLLGVASLVMVRARTKGRDRDNVIDAFIAMVALAVLLAAWLFESGAPPSDVTGLDRAWVVASPLVLAAVLGASVRVVFAGGQRAPAAWLLLLASSLTLAGNVWTTTLIRDGEPTVLLGIDIFWVLGFVAVGASALHPSMRELTEPLPSNHALARVPTDRIWLLGTALCAAPLALLKVTNGAASAAAMAFGGLLVAMLAMWRINRLLAERDIAREVAATSANQDAIIATVGRWAVDDVSTDQLLADTDRLLAERSPHVRCRRISSPAPIDVDGHGRRHLVTTGSHAVAEVVASADPPTDAVQEPGFLEAIAALLSAAVQRRAAEAKLLHESTHDLLTGLPNRSLALSRLAQLLDGDADASLAVIFIDLDDFKSVNDAFGHAGGDRVLREVARRLLEAVRDTDTVARLGGDEFIVVVPTGDRVTLRSLAERVRVAANFTMDGPGGRPTSVDASIGVSTGRGATTSAEALLDQADLAMYAAKQDGSGIMWKDVGDGPASIWGLEGERSGPPEPGATPQPAGRAVS